MVVPVPGPLRPTSTGLNPEPENPRLVHLTTREGQGIKGQLVRWRSKGEARGQTQTATTSKQVLKTLVLLLRDLS